MRDSSVAWRFKPSPPEGEAGCAFPDCDAWGYSGFMREVGGLTVSAVACDAHRDHVRKLLDQVMMPDTARV